jgi:hypothetical protein
MDYDALRGKKPPSYATREYSNSHRGTPADFLFQLVTMAAEAQIIRYLRHD